MTITPNALFHADCVEMMRRMESESVDLVYLDPPLFVPSEYRDGSRRAGESTSFRHLQFISIVCQHVYRILKLTGVLFFHAQPSFTFSIRLILNQIFGTERFRDEIVWQYGPSRMGGQHDAIICFHRSSTSTDNILRRSFTRDEIQCRFPKSDERGPFALTDLTAAAVRPKLQFAWNGFLPPLGRSWRFDLATLQKFEEDGMIHHGQKMPMLKVSLSEKAGPVLGTIWTDVPHLSRGLFKERTGYATQKPLGLIERLICKGSNPGDTVMDPFCGSGTTIVAAERHQRKWIACEISKEAIDIAKRRFAQEVGKAKFDDVVMGDTETLSHISVKPALLKRVKIKIEDLSTMQQVYILGQPVSFEETRSIELKEIKSYAGAVDSIVNTADEYAVAFLNSQGGCIYWGIRDIDRVVTGVPLNYQQRDHLRRQVTEKLNQIEPKLDPSQYRVETHEVLNESGEAITDMWVVELIVPLPSSTDPYYTGGGQAWIRVDGIKKKLKGIALTDFIKRRLAEKQ